MTGLALYGDGRRQIPFFAGPDERYRTAYPGRQPLDNAAAFVHNARQVNAALLQ